MDAPNLAMLCEDAAFVARWKAAIAREPLSEQVRKTEFMEICFSLERQLHEVKMDLRDCNVIMARTVGRLEMGAHHAR